MRQDAALADVVLELPAVRLARCVAVYAHLPGEPGTTLIRQGLARRGVEVLLPVVAEDLHLDWAREEPVGDDGASSLDEQRLVPSRYAGGPEPTGPRLGQAALERADVVLVPALAVDDRGHRLGQGAGCYDRALAWVLPGTPVLALLHDDEVLDSSLDPIPVEPHDRGVDGVLTPTRWIRLLWVTHAEGTR